MKTPFTLALIFFLFYLPTTQAQYTFGIKGSFTKAWFDDVKDAKMEGIGTTLLLYKKVNKFLEIGTEPGVVNRGTSQVYGQVHPTMIICCFGPCTFPIPDGPGRGLKTSYVQAPLMTRASVPLAKNKLTLFAKVGGGPSYLASGYYDTEEYDEFSFEVTPTTKALDFSEEDSPKRLDWGIYSGAGLGYRIGFGLLSIETEWYHGLSEVMNYSDYKNRSISYALSYSISL